VQQNALKEEKANVKKTLIKLKARFTLIISFDYQTVMI
jgi:hypothetical protein